MINGFATHNRFDSFDSDFTIFEARGSEVISIGAQNVVINSGSLGSALSVTVNNVAPTFSAGGSETVLPPQVGELNRTINFTDPGTLDVWTGTVNFSDGSGNQPLAINQATKSFDLNHTYLADGTYTVTVTVEDDDLGSMTDTFAVTVLLNTPPVADAGGPYTADEGAGLALDATGSTDAQNNITSYAWDLDNDGQFDDALGAAPNVSSATLVALGLGDDGTYPIGVLVTDSFGASDTAATTVRVNNVAPQLQNIAITSPINENDFATLTGDIVDPGTNDPFTLTIDWGDGSPVETFNYAAGTNSFSEKHQYLDDDPPGTSTSTYQLAVALADDDGSGFGNGADNGILYVTQFGGNSGALVAVQTGTLNSTFVTTVSTETGIAVRDTVRIINAFPSSLQSGSEYDLSGNVLNSNIYSNTSINSLYDGTTDGEYNYSIGHNDFDSNFGVFRFDLDWSNPIQIFTPNRRSSGIAYDAVTNTLWTTATVGTASHVQNYSLDGAFLSEFPVNIRGGYAIAWNPADDTLWIPESFETTGRLWQYDKSGNLLQNPVIGGLHSNPFGAEFQMGDSGTDQAKIDITVNNIDPVIVSVNAPLINEDGTATVTGSFTDVSTLDTHTAVIDWGDGTTSNATIDPVSRTFSADHQYLDDNPTGTGSDVYTIGVTLTDDDTGTDTASTTVTVNNLDPVIASVNAPVINEDGTATITGSFTDVGTLDTHTVQINWGDGTTSNATIDPLARTFTADHPYLDDNPTGTAS